MTNRGRPTTRAKGLKNGFYLELKVKGSNRGTRIMRETHEQAMLALTQFENKIVRLTFFLTNLYFLGKTCANELKKISGFLIFLFQSLHSETTSILIIFLI